MILWGFHLAGKSHPRLSQTEVAAGSDVQRRDVWQRIKDLLCQRE